MDVRKSFPAMGSESVLVTFKNETRIMLMFQIALMTVPTNYPEFVKEALAVKGIVQVNIEKLQGLPQHQPLHLRNQVIVLYIIVGCLIHA
jgi:hypothetical protein